MNIACLLVVPFVGLLAAGQPPNEFYRVGTGRVDITPEGPIWLAGYGDRKKPSEGVEQHLFAKALAIVAQCANKDRSPPPPGYFRHGEAKVVVLHAKPALKPNLTEATQRVLKRMGMV